MKSFFLLVLAFTGLNYGPFEMAGTAETLAVKAASGCVRAF